MDRNLFYRIISAIYNVAPSGFKRVVGPYLLGFPAGRRLVTGLNERSIDSYVLFLAEREDPKYRCPEGLKKLVLESAKRHEN